jgi:hypothetical protein
VRAVSTDAVADTLRAPLTPEAACAELSTLTEMTPAEWRDFLSLDCEAQLAVAQTYRDAAWVKNADTLAAVLAVLSLVIPIVGAVSGAASAANALRQL